MAPSTQWALHDFVRLAGDEGCTLYFERFLRDGFPALTPTHQASYPGLRCWRGISDLKRTLTNLVSLPDGAKTFIAGRSANLMKVAARLLFRRRKPVVVPDLAWPSYQHILARGAQKVSTRIDLLPVRSRLLGQKLDAKGLIDSIVAALHRSDAGGLFLPEISHDGIRLPVGEIVHQVRRETPSVAMVIDGSQALGQVPVDLSRVPCDLYLGAGRLRRFTETVNLSPLFACRGALESQLIEGRLPDLLRRRLANAELLRRIAGMTKWIPLNPDVAFRSASVLLQASSRHIRSASPQCLREQFHACGVALTCYRNGVLCLAMPAVSLSRSDAGQLFQALALVPLRARRPNHALCA